MIKKKLIAINNKVKDKTKLKQQKIEETQRIATLKINETSDIISNDNAVFLNEEVLLDTTSDKSKINVLAKSSQLKSIFEHSIIGHPLEHFFIPTSSIHRFTIKVAANNIFCTLKNTDTNLMFHSVSSGKYKITVTKRTIKKDCKDILDFFLNDLQDKQFNFTQPVILTITAPNHFKKFIFEVLENHVLSKICEELFFFVEAKDKKVFNGCRPKKLVHKRRMNLAEFV